MKLNPKKEIRPAVARGVVPGQAIETVEVAPDDLVEIEFEKGERLWMRGDEYRRRFGGPPVRAAGAEAGGQELLILPSALPVLPPGLQARGPVAWVVKGLKVFGLDLGKWTAEKIAGKIDDHTDAQTKAPELQRRPRLGLSRCSMETGAFRLPAPTNVAEDDSPQPWLLFIHGTAASTWKSFGDLWSKPRAKELEALRLKYGDRVLAFDHASLVKSPIDNALELARSLPCGARLHLVTHSRGGLIGELLCRANVVAASGATAAPFSPDELAALRDSRDGADAASLEALANELQARRFVIDRFVRVACPALGTTLASRRLDRWLSVIGTVAGMATPDTALGEFFTDIGDFIAAVIEERTNPETLAGLEALMPDSRFIALMNWPEVTVAGSLSVVAGDIDPRARWSRLLVWLSDRFYDGDHDLIVNTPSMSGGAARADGAVVSVHKGPAVNHFTYFSEAESAAHIVAALVSDKPAAKGFEPLVKPTAPIARTVVSRGTTARPIVLVIPGMMGSQLAADGALIWPRPLALLQGGLDALKIDSDKTITAPAILAGTYGALIERLSQSHDVLPFPYDWRLPLTTVADQLAEAVRDILRDPARQGQPIRIVAHSSGGLLVRLLMARQPAYWRDITARSGSRVLMLGTPNRGSPAIAALLAGESLALRQLARLDLHHKQPELRRILIRFPGLLALLPQDAGDDFLAPAVWQGFQRSLGADWITPLDADLRAAAVVRKMLDDAPIDVARMIYIAGQADATPERLQIVAGADGAPRLEVQATLRGDGQVTWDSGPLPGVPTFYLDVEHGDLASHEPSFDALEELLSQGTTKELMSQPPLARGAAISFAMPAAEDDLYPNTEALTRSMMGAGSRRRRSIERREPRVKVNVAHGHLAFARHPVTVGHYTGDTIISAERHLDLGLDGALTRRHLLDRYPGPLETSAVFLNLRPYGPRGAVVVGLGPVGQLTASALRRTVRTGLLEYLLEKSKEKKGDPDEKLGISALLIGTGAGGISVTDSIFALLNAVREANAAMATLPNDASRRIQEVEILELWEDRAIEAMQVLRQCPAQDPILSRAFDIDNTLGSRTGGLRRRSYVEPLGWWQRLQILGNVHPGEPDRGLRFTAVTGRARNEVRLQPTQRALVDQFVNAAVATTRDDQTVSHTLFELLLPNDLKEEARDQDNIVLLLDEGSASYPWELLQDPYRGKDMPWSVAHGVLRQLELKEFRERPIGAAENTALVIGDPMSSFPELKGAQREAEEVASTLQGPFLVNYLRPRPTGREVMSALLPGPYKVLHLAGHGVYRFTPRTEPPPCPNCGQSTTALEEPITGMVIGDGLFLTPREVEQMRRVPELVFINCCFLGRVEDAPPYHRLAANVATQFIRMGVRAVVAAGWAVEDAAAALFATTLYQCLLTGETFGIAVRSARQATFDRYRGSNTWGAYQCYGDPGYRLVRTGVQATSDDLRIYSAAQAAQEVLNVAATLQTADGDVWEREVGRLRKIREYMENNNASWLDCGDVCAALGYAYSEAQLLDESMTFYERAVGRDDATVTLKDIEQLANVRVRRAIAQWRKGPMTAAAAADCEQAIETSIETLTQLIGGTLGEKPPHDANTSERLSLLGSAYKRLAWCRNSGSDGQGEALKHMLDHYQKAYERKKEPYPALNWVMAQLVWSWNQQRSPGGASPLDPQIPTVLDDARDQNAAELKQERNFWAEARAIELDLLRKMLDGRLTDQELNELGERYEQLQQRNSGWKFESVRDQLEFLLAMARGTTLESRLQVLRDRVAREAAR